MSVDEDTVKTGSPSASSTSLQLSEHAGSYSSVSAATPDADAACPVPHTAASPKHASNTDAHSDNGGQRVRGNENSVNRRNSFHNSKHQQQIKVTKRRNTSNFNFKHPTFGKRRRRANSESDSVLPTNFLLGGNIFDPLNLNSLMDEDVNRALNAETPKSSPLPAKSRDPVEILIPRDITDPLNLNSGLADSSFLVSPFKSGGRRRHRNRHHGGTGGGSAGFSTINVSEEMRVASGRNEAKTSMPDPVAVNSCSALELSKDSNSLSGVTRESHEHSTDTSTSLKDELSVSLDDSTSSVNQHTSRRKRRRNSGKMDPPVNHSTPMEKRCAPGGSFHTPRAGSKPGGHPHQLHHSQAKSQQKKFQYGNYNKYYGYRNPSASEDPRIRVFHPEWFEGKDVLDLGCNSGHLTLYVAKTFRPARILGLDIDSGLVHAARKNIRHYLSELQTKESRRATHSKDGGKSESNGHECNKSSEPLNSDHATEQAELLKTESGPTESLNDTCQSGEKETQNEDTKEPDCCKSPSDHSASCTFPLSLRISRGPIAAPPLSEMPNVHPGEFPSNVSFIKANYVLENENLLLTQRPEYDVILCLSVTKWVHLNWGDSGLKRLFNRAFRHLRPGGKFILEPQPWESYVRRKKLTDNINKNYRSIRLKPDQFTSFLTNEVGFSSFEYLGTPKCSVRGFQRPMYLFHK
ncbi:7SK snRNA methylphosphate capping enzyme-like [Neosynchiropus ocellatus]